MSTKSPTMLGGPAKEIKTTKISIKSRQRPKGQIYSSQIKSKDSVQMPSHSQLKSKETHQYNLASLDAQQPRENALKGSANYSALLQKAHWLETRQRYLRGKYLRERRNSKHKK